jgi:hypothetical protein
VCNSCVAMWFVTNALIEQGARKGPGEGIARVRPHVLGLHCAAERSISAPRGRSLPLLPQQGQASATR